MNSLRVLDLIYQQLLERSSRLITDVDYDGDNKDGSLVITTTTDQGEKQEWIIRSRDIDELDSDGDVVGDHVVCDACEEKIPASEATPEHETGKPLCPKCLDDPDSPTPVRA